MERQDALQFEDPYDEECVNFGKVILKASSPNSKNNDSHNKESSQEANEEPLPSKSFAESVAEITSTSNPDTSDKLHIQDLKEDASGDCNSENKRDMMQRNKFHSPPSTIFTPVVKV